MLNIKEIEKSVNVKEIEKMLENKNLRKEEKEMIKNVNGVINEGSKLVVRIQGVLDKAGEDVNVIETTAGLKTLLRDSAKYIAATPYSDDFDDVYEEGSKEYEENNIKYSVCQSMCWLLKRISKEAQVSFVSKLGKEMGIDFDKVFNVLSEVSLDMTKDYEANDPDYNFMGGYFQSVLNGSKHTFRECALYKVASDMARTFDDAAEEDFEIFEYYSGGEDLIPDLKKIKDTMPPMFFLSIIDSYAFNNEERNKYYISRTIQDSSYNLGLIDFDSYKPNDVNNK